MPINKWVPYNPFVDTGKLYYTLHLRNNDLVTINEVKKDDFVTLYPNPAHNSFAIEFSENNDNSTHIVVFDLMGKTVLDKIFTLNENKAYVQFQGIAAGLYAVQIKKGNKTYFRKVTIE